LHDLYVHYTGGGTDRQYELAKSKLKKYVLQTVDGPLKNMRPKNGITLYRGRHKNESREPNRVYSFSHSRRTADFFGEKNGKIDEIVVTPDLPALDLSFIQPGALAAEVLVVFPKHMLREVQDLPDTSKLPMVKYLISDSPERYRERLEASIAPIRNEFFSTSGAWQERDGVIKVPLGSKQKTKLDMAIERAAGNDVLKQIRVMPKS
jgi:hypothetical protein